MVGKAALTPANQVRSFLLIGNSSDVLDRRETEQLSQNFDHSLVEAVERQESDQEDGDEIDRFNY